MRYDREMHDDEEIIPLHKYTNSLAIQITSSPTIFPRGRGYDCNCFIHLSFATTEKEYPLDRQLRTPRIYRVILTNQIVRI